jgi:hypothetical protein
MNKTAQHSFLYAASSSAQWNYVYNMTICIALYCFPFQSLAAGMFVRSRKTKHTAAQL